MVIIIIRSYVENAAEQPGEHFQHRLPAQSEIQCPGKRLLLNDTRTDIWNDRCEPEFCDFHCDVDGAQPGGSAIQPDTEKFRQRSQNHHRREIIEPFFLILIQKFIIIDHNLQNDHDKDRKEDNGKIVIKHKKKNLSDKTCDLLKPTRVYLISCRKANVFHHFTYILQKAPRFLPCPVYSDLTIRHKHEMAVGRMRKLPAKCR